MYAAFPAKLHKFQILESLPLSRFFEQANPLTSSDPSKVSAFIKALRKPKKDLQRSEVNNQFDIEIACWLRFSEPPSHAVALAIEFTDADGHWLQVMDEIKNFNSNEGLFSGKIFFKANHLHNANIVCTKLANASVFIDDLNLSIKPAEAHKHAKKVVNHR